MIFSFRYLTKILVGDYLQQRSFEANTCWFKSSRVKIASALCWSQARWIIFRSNRLGEGVLQEDLGLFSLRLFRSCVKVDSIDILKFICTHKFKVWFWFNPFWFSCQKHRYISYMYIGFYPYIICFKVISISCFYIYMCFRKIGFPFQSLVFEKYQFCI